MPTHTGPKQVPSRHSPYPKRQRTQSSKSMEAKATPVPPKPRRRKQLGQKPQTETSPDPTPVLHSPLFNGINPAYLVRAMREIARGGYSRAHGYLHLCIVQARRAAASQGGASPTVVCLLMLYSDNWLRLGIPSRAVASMKDALAAQEQMGEETEEDRNQATLAGLELREHMGPETAGRS
ncbi:hypothetical protein FRC12_000053 [Ceratobasidium sp. 428]|nr:hypothetical protein FRC12_000053 [Ceratobasidium sp. 428]